MLFQTLRISHSATSFIANNYKKLQLVNSKNASQTLPLYEFKPMKLQQRWKSRTELTTTNCSQVKKTKENEVDSIRRDGIHISHCKWGCCTWLCSETGWFRSDSIHWCKKLSIATSRALLIIVEQLNSELTPFQRRYVSYVKRCDEMERKLRFFETELGKFNIKPQVASMNTWLV